MVEHETHLAYTKKGHDEEVYLLKQAIKSLEDDKDLKSKHIGQRSLCTDSLKSDLEMMGRRLDKQVEVDQAIE